MAASPSNIVRRMSGVINGKATINAIKHAFITAGYGPGKTMRWIELYLAEEILYDTGERDENGKELFGCVWWLS